MRNVLFLFIFISSTVHAQTYTPLPDSAGIWVNEFATYHFDDDWMVEYDLKIYTNYCSNGVDTLIGGENYTIIDTCMGGYKGAFRESSGQVYFVPKGELSEYLLYDFTANDGDTLYDVYIEEDWTEELGWGLYDLEVTVPTMDSILIDGAYRKFVYAGEAQWIEGIGNEAGLFKGSGNNVSNYFISLFCHSAEERTLYPYAGDGSCYLFNSITKTDPIDLAIFPNPTSGMLTIDISSLNSEFQIEVYNFLGELVYQEVAGMGLETTIDLASLKSGNYLLTLRNENDVYKQKVVKL